MDLQKLTRSLRLILYKNTNCENVITEFERVLKEYNMKGVINISDENEAIIVDVEPLIQFIRVKKKNPVRVYQVIPKISPIKEVL